MFVYLNAKDTTAQASLRSWYVVGVLALAYAVSIVDRLIMPISIREVRHSLGISDFEISLMMGLAFAIFYTLCGLPLGALIDRVSRRWVIFGGMLTWSLAASACGLASTPAQLFGARMLVGAGEAALSPAAYSIMSDLFPKERLAAPISVFTIGGTLGSAVALAAGGPLLQYFTAHGGLVLPWFGTLESWQSLYFSAGFPGLVCLMLIFTLREPVRTARAGRPHAETSLLAFLRPNRRLYSLLFLGFGAAAMLPYGFSAWIPALMMRSYGLGPAVVGKVFGLIVGVCGLTAHGINGFVVDALFRRGVVDAHLRFYVISALVSTPLVVIGFLSGNWLWLLAGVVAAYLVLTPFVGYAAAALQIITPPQMRGRMSALYLFVISGIGLGVGPSLVAALSDLVFRSEARLGAALACFTAICAGAAALLLTLAMRRFREAVAAAGAAGAAT
jgi:MFS family permease